MKGLLVFCGLLCVAVSTVHSASFYYRSGRLNVEGEAVAPVQSEPSAIKEALAQEEVKQAEVVSELRKDAVPLQLEEAVPVAVVAPLVKEEIVIPVETLRIAEPIIAIQEPAGVISDNKPLKDSLIAEPAILVAVDEARAEPETVLPAKLEHLEVAQPAEANLKTATIQETVKAAAEEAVREANVAAEEPVLVVETVETVNAPEPAPAVRAEPVPENREVIVEVVEAKVEQPIEAVKSVAAPLAETPVAPIVPAPSSETVQVAEPAQIVESVPALKSAEPIAAQAETVEVKAAPAEDAQPLPVAEVKPETVVAIAIEQVAEVKAAPAPAVETIVEPVQSSETVQVAEPAKIAESVVPALKSAEPIEALAEATIAEQPKAEAPIAVVEVKADTPAETPIQATRSAIAEPAVPEVAPEAAVAAVVQTVEPAAPAVAETSADQASLRDAGAVPEVVRQQPTIIQQAQDTFNEIIQNIPIISNIRRPSTEEPEDETLEDEVASATPTTSTQRPGFIQNIISNIPFPFRPSRVPSTAAPAPPSEAPEKPSTTRGGDRPIPIVNEKVEIVDDKVDLSRS